MIKEEICNKIKTGIYSLSSNRKTDRFEIHVSDLTNYCCLRNIALAYQNKIYDWRPDKIKDNLDTKLIFWHGIYIEKMLENFFKVSNTKYTKSKIQISFKDALFICNPDFLIYHNDQLHIVECKSASKNSFYNMVLGNIQYSYILQINFYLWAASLLNQKNSTNKWNSEVAYLVVFPKEKPYNTPQFLIQEIYFTEEKNIINTIKIIKQILNESFIPPKSDLCYKDICKVRDFC